MMINPFILLRITHRDVDLQAIVLGVFGLLCSVKGKPTLQNVAVKAF